MQGNETFVVCGDVQEVKKPLNASTYQQKYTKLD